MRILSWAEVQEIVDRFISLNPYDPNAVKGSILNLVDATFADSHSNKSQRQLYRYSIAAKRYTLYVKTRKSEIDIIDPKAHGVAFLYPPKNSPNGWDEDIPQWIYGMWDYIVRSSLGLKCTLPTWVEIPQMMRLNVSTYNFLKMLAQWQRAHPYNFLPSLANDRSVIWICILSTRKRKDSVGMPVFIRTRAPDRSRMYKRPRWQEIPNDQLQRIR